MKVVEVKPRQDNLYDIWVHAKNGKLLLHSSQGYENVEDAEAVVRELWPPIHLPTGDGLQWSVNLGDGDDLTHIPTEHILGTIELLKANTKQAVVLRVTYRDGKTKTEQLR